jgi:adenylyl-sulfate kinase
MGRPTGLVVWLTGLSGAGKSTVANAVAPMLSSRGWHVEILDGDAVRARLWPELGYKRRDRDMNVERLAWLAACLGKLGSVVLVAAIAPFAAARATARATVEEHIPFVEVHIATPLTECIRRDPKGHYARALIGELPLFTGVSDPYEEPRRPDLRIDTTCLTATECAVRIVAFLEANQPITRDGTLVDEIRGPM